jgi:Trk-type K+ transport system membrane component
MTPKASTARLLLYVAIAMVTSASAGFQTVDFSEWKQVAGFTLSVLATGLVTARSYIDQSPTLVSKPDP